MSRDLYVQDTAKVYFTSLTTGNVVGVGYAQSASIEQSVEETDIRGGIGNKLAWVLRSSKDITLNITSATFKPEFFELTQGTEYQSVTKEITDSKFLKVADNAGTLEITLPADMTALTTVRVEDVDGDQEDVAVVSGVVELPIGFTAQDGDTLEVFYLKNITGRGLDFDASKFGSKVKVEYSTLCYDRATQSPYSNIHFEFPETTPSGAFTMNLSNGEAYIPELSFRVTATDGSDVLGTKTEELIV